MSSISIGTSFKGSVAAAAAAQVWVYYYDGVNSQVIKRRKISDTGGTEIETISTNTTAIPTTLKSGIGHDLTEGIIAVGSTSATQSLYEIDVDTDNETNITTGGHDWVYDVQAQPDLSRWLYVDNGNTLYSVPYGGGTATAYTSVTGDWIADDATNDYILTAKESSGGVKRWSTRTTPTSGSGTTIHSGITARCISVDPANGLAFYGDRSADKLWKTQYSPTVGSNVELDSFTPDAIGAVDYIAEEDLVYYIVDTNIYTINPDGTGKTLVYDLAQNGWGAKFIYTT